MGIILAKFRVSNRFSFIIFFFLASSSFFSLIKTVIYFEVNTSFANIIVVDQKLYKMVIFTSLLQYREQTQSRARARSAIHFMFSCFSCLDSSSHLFQFFFFAFYFIARQNAQRHWNAKNSIIESNDKILCVYLLLLFFFFLFFSACFSIVSWFLYSLS